MRFKPPPLARFSPVARWVRQFGLMLAGVAISLMVKENYPFSHNPMYSKFDPYTYYLHATDEKGETLLFREQFGFSAIRLKKVFTTKMKEVEKNPETKQLPREERFRIAGEGTLLQYHRQRRPETGRPMEYRGLRLLRTDIRLAPGKIDERVAVIAEIDVSNGDSGNDR